MALILNLNLNLGASSLWFSRPLNIPNTVSYSSSTTTTNDKANALFFLSLSRSTTSFKPKATSNSNEDADASPPSLLTDELLKRVSTAKDADEALDMIAEMSPPQQANNTVTISDCCSIITAALGRNNVELALSVYSATRSAFRRGMNDSNPFVDKWKWDRPNVHIYALLVQGLASSLQVSKAIMIINDVCRVGISSSSEVPFGKVVRCPSCMIAVSVAQPQHGIQIASCSGCRCQYELVSGNIASIESEEISMDIPAWERGLRFLQVMKQSIPAAVHSIVVQTPTGIARTYRFATKTVELPAQEGERVTVCLAAPSDVYRKVGPFRFISKTPGFNSGEPMCLTNHTDGRESQLLRAPSKNENFSLRNPSVLFPLLALLATGDAASGIIDPSLPQLISVSAVASVALGTTLNMVVLPQLNRLPQRKVDVLAIKQKLLSQYDLLQTRLKDLRQAAEDEVWMLARMCQLENKILAVGEPSYRARRSRIKSVRESLENSLVRRIELIDSYARISSLIEIEVEMDSDVPAAEATSSTENIAEQIEQIMELENLEQRWRMQAEANDEVERLLSTDPVPTEQV